MGWDSVPWFVGGGAQHSPEIARVQAYAAFRGNEGILGPGDLKVRALGVPGTSVTVDPGVCSILCRATGQQYQAYAGRCATQDSVDVAATSAGAGRSDLVVARVEDPWLSGEPWPDPVDATTGPYIFTRLIPNVPATTRTVAQLNLGYSAIELARIDIPASTGTITQAMITDLRKVANPRRDRQIDAIFPSTPVSANTTAFKVLGTSRAFTVPMWARAALVTVNASGLGVYTGNVFGELRSAFAGLVSQITVVDENWTGNPHRTSYMVAAEMVLPAALAGTTQTVRLEGRRTTGPGTLDANSGTTISVDIEFRETAE